MVTKGFAIVDDLSKFSYNSFRYRKKGEFLLDFKIHQEFLCLVNAKCAYSKTFILFLL